MNSLKIFLRTDHLNQDGTHAVCIRLLSDRRKKDILLRIYVKGKDWFASKSFVKKSDPAHIRKNKLIRKYISKAQDIVHDAFFNDETGSVQILGDKKKETFLFPFVVGSPMGF